MGERAGLFDPIEIGGVRLRNRTLLPSMTTRLADDAGYVTDATLAYYRARAEGGVGLVTVEMASPEIAGKHRFRELGIYDDMFLPGLRRLVETVHEAGARASIQLGHGGSRARSAVSGTTPVAPSAVPTPVFEVESEIAVPEAMSPARIRETVDAYVAAAARAQRAGFDMVELHGAHGYLISQFLSPLENTRTDCYGGSLENRARFGLEILRRIKSEVPGLPVIFRIGVEDFFPGGLTADEGIQVGRWSERDGADAVSVTAGHYRSLPAAERMIPPMAYPAATFVEYAARMKRLVDVPVIGVGRLGDPDLAARAVADGKLDVVALGRPLIADPHWVVKAQAGAPVRRCLACNHCITNMRSGAQLSCVVNPATGRENVYAGTSAPQSRRIVVLGAGPAGLSYASLVAAGNDVTVIDKADRAGGAFRLTGLAPRFNDVAAAEPTFEAYIGELERACRLGGVRFRYGSEATGDDLRGADLVAVATGADYRFGLGAVVPRLLRTRAARSGAAARLFASARVRDSLYYRLRTGRGAALARRLPLEPGTEVLVLGDAARAGKAREAITSAFDAALAPRTHPAPTP
ncbi:2,4-dienoyl-CoA reductase-like NADH-dependent reductase (Old Yellow Enzyme family) [Pseudonocardia sediminis]|uniref:2,4-dienoyl-CoA reductase-like NADH-dependent reductase (Old Yellow Enzyme family) n=1 Tax=Pseudonocardia sediminis TaxID=1397368 RepID=A0A4V2FQR1_PSEST|nr:NADH:flavin oxidoreductase [Pseudonocardia sediminis]RZT85740.1 2,4-dienoyl-CoA reductase-like NADH-dependent reductase (Old Yellow Enzyme family) [Pseudonocardia sediminis]